MKERNRGGRGEKRGRRIKMKTGYKGREKRIGERREEGAGGED